MNKNMSNLNLSNMNSTKNINNVIENFDSISLSLKDHIAHLEVTTIIAY